MKRIHAVILSVLIGLAGGCSWQLQEVRGKTKFGPEFRDILKTSSVRWTSIQQGFEMKWDNGWKTGLTYRRRDVDQGRGGNDNGVWFDFSYPLWQRPKKPDTTARRIESLERQLAKLQENQDQPDRNRVASRQGVNHNMTNK